MSLKVNISFIGAGNVAWHLAPALDNVGFSVMEVFSPTHKSASALVGRLYQATVKKDLDFRDSPSQVFILAVPDDAIEDVAGEMLLPEGAVVVHTSGSQTLEALRHAPTENTGVFYPLQTFSKSQEVDFWEIPIFVEVAHPDMRDILMDLARSISGQVGEIDSEHRKALHVAAVFACNFTNHLMTLSKDILDKARMDFGLLRPLVQETIRKSLSIGPDKAQTGPAIREDMKTLDEHVRYLDEHVPEHSEVYRVVTQHILDTYASH